MDDDIVSKSEKVEWIFIPEDIANADRDGLFTLVNRFEKIGARVPKNIDLFGVDDLRKLCELWNRDERLISNYISEDKPKSEPILIDADYHLTDAGNSERLVKEYGEDIRYCHTFKSWYIWNGKIWAPDQINKILEYATNTAKGIYSEAAHSPDSEKLARWAIRSESLPARRAMVDGATFHVPVIPEELDDQPELFNLKNGTLDLSDFSFRKHDKIDMLTKIAGVEYNPECECPLWLEHLKTIFCDNQDIIDAFQEVCGYTLLQYNPEQICFILWGNGKNGKSETMKVMSLIMNDYSVNIEASTLMQSRHDEAGRARPDVLRLKGSRLVTVTEPGKNDQLSEPLIKSVTGDHCITARPLYGAPVEFKPGGKVFISTNYLPKIQGQDDGIWRRIWLFPFNVIIPPEKRQPDYGDYLFEEEGPGILNWMLQGLKRYYDRGELDQPEDVKKATQKYKLESNPVGKFINDWCVIHNLERTGKGDFYKKYCDWCDDVGWKPLSQKKIGMLMENMFQSDRDGNNRYWIGIRVKTEVEILEGESKKEIQNTLSDGGDACDTSLPNFLPSTRIRKSLGKHVTCDIDENQDPSSKVLVRITKDVKETIQDLDGVSYDIEKCAMFTISKQFADLIVKNEWGEIVRVAK